MKRYVAFGALFVAIIVASLVTGGERSFLKFQIGESLQEFDQNLEWRFVHGQFVEPSEAAEVYRDGELVEVPHRFVEHYEDEKQYGTYIARLTIPEQYIDEKLALFIPFEYGSYRLYVDDFLIASNGVVAMEESEQVPKMKPTIGQFQAAQQEVYVTMHLSNFHSKRGGLGQHLQIGEPEELFTEYITSIIFSYFVNGIIFIVGLFSLLLSIFNRRNKEGLLFALFCIVVAVRSIYARPFTYAVTLFDVPWELAVKIESVCTMLIVGIGLLFCHGKFQVRVAKPILAVAYTVLGLQIALILITEPAKFQTTFPYVFVAELMLMAYMVLSASSLDEDTSVHIFGVCVVFFSALHDLAVVLLGLNAPMLVQFMVLVYILLMVYTISRQYGQKMKETEKLNLEIMKMNAELDHKVKARTLELEEANKQLEILAMRDGLTGIANRYVFDQQLKYYFEEALFLEEDMSLLLFDLDSFKKYNDHYGHVHGDKLLQQVVAEVEKVLPPDVVFARYGGEEFAIIAPYMEAHEMKPLGERIVKAVADARFEHVGQESGIATISVGGHTMTMSCQFTSPKQLIRVTDEQLYLAKQRGRNCFVMKEEAQ